MTKFLHTSDWHLGQTRSFLKSDAQAEYSLARIDAVRELAKLAEREGCEFVLVCGDIFESNQVDDKVVNRSLEAMGSFGQPVLILPGNHDSFDASSVYLRDVFRTNKPDHVVVLESPGIHAVPGSSVTLAAAPLLSKTVDHDLASEVIASLRAEEASVDVLVAHGITSELNPDRDRADAISVEGLESAIRDGLFGYAALGDRHGFIDSGISTSNRVIYSGAPVATGYRDKDSGNALVVSLEDGAAEITPHRIGRWQFITREFQVNSAEDIDALKDSLESIEDKHEAVVKLTLKGVVSLEQSEQLQVVLDRYEDLLGGLEFWKRHEDLVIKPTDADFKTLAMAGYAASALEDLREQASRETEDAAAAQDALDLFFRLARPKS